MLDLIVWLEKLVPAFSLLVYSLFNILFNILFKKEVGWSDWLAFSWGGCSGI